MMSRLCLLAALLCLPLGCFGVPDACEDELDMAGLPPDEFNNYKAYTFQADVVGECTQFTETCRATIIPNTTLSGRTWFITNIKPNYGRGYGNNVIQEFRVQCPRGTLLHLFVQQSDLPQPDVSTGCNDVDSVRIQATGLGPDDEVTFCGDFDDVLAINELYNNGLGRIIADGKANISFCSNNNLEVPGEAFDGFVIRATCLQPADLELPGCNDLAFVMQWDPLFADSINTFIPEVKKVSLPHRKKRMVSKGSVAWALKNMHREKKFVSDSIELSNEETVRYSGGNLTIIFADGTGDTRLIPRISCLVAFNSLVGTRWFIGFSRLEFRGPGKLDIFGTYAGLTYTIAPENLENFFLPGHLEMNAANVIYNYIYDNYISAYPIIDPMRGIESALPLQDANTVKESEIFQDLDLTFRPAKSFGFIQEDIQEGVCRRARLNEEVPSYSARLPAVLTRYCNFFERSCDPTLRAACRELNRLDSLSVGK